MAVLQAHQAKEKNAAKLAAVANAMASAVQEWDDATSSEFVNVIQTRFPVDE